MNKKDFLKKLRCTLYISEVINKFISINKAINDTSNGIEEIEKELKKKNKAPKD